MKKKVIIHEFDPVIYPRKVWIVVTNNPQVLRDNFEFEEDCENHFESSAAFVFYCSQKETRMVGMCICFMQKANITMKIVAHESVHVATSMFTALNMSFGLDYGKDEPFAYLVGWIAECCEKVKLNKE